MHKSKTNKAPGIVAKNERKAVSYELNKYDSLIPFGNGMETVPYPKISLSKKKRSENTLNQNVVSTLPAFALGFSWKTFASKKTESAGM